ncbi:MAG: insulinase family protein [Deltaproteobacteria bacterium]|nr:insulinase family protein [Deltaproteobacteria bacterium]
MHRKTILGNGVRIITERLEHFRSVSLGLWVNVGSRDEEGRENGISHFIEHMTFKGTRTRNSFQIAKELDAIGGFSNAFTGKEYTCFHSKVLDKHFTTLADILSDIFLNSTFDPEEIDRERQVILQEINMADDTPDEHVHELFNRLFWTDHPLGMSVLGTGETVSALDKKAILDYITRFYTPDRIVIAATGSIDHEEVVDFFRPLFEPLNHPGTEIPSIDSPHIRQGVSCFHKDLEQAHICMGGKAPHLLSDRRFAGAILNTILGGNMSSRLFQEIREKRGLAYSIYSFLSAYIDTGLMGVSMGTGPHEVNKALGIINVEISKIRSGEISGVDLAAAKEHLTGGILLGSESADARMMRLARNEYVFGRYVSYEDLVEELEKVTVDEVIGCSREIFQTGKVSLATLGPIKKEELDLDCLQFN